jgi:archaellum component FlaC
MPNPTDERLAEAVEHIEDVLRDIEDDLEHIKDHLCSVMDRYYGCRDALQEPGEEES